MLRPIPEDESDNGAVAVDTLDSLSAAAAVASIDGEGGARSVISAASAVLANGRDDDDDENAKDGLIKKRPSKKRKKRRRRRSRWASWRSFAVIGVVIAAAVLIVCVILTTTNGSDEETAQVATTNGSPTPTSSPTMSPTIDPVTEASLDELVSGVSVSMGIDKSSSPEVEAIFTAAREKARDWMLTQDLLRDEILADPTQVRFTQRYTLVLMLFSMQFNSGDVEAIQDDILAAEESECSWTGVYCDDAIVEQTATTTIRLPVVRRIHWGEQNAIGAVAPEIRSLVYLQEFNVSYNSLQGSVPSAWFETPNSVNASALVPEVERNFYLPYLYLLDLGYNNLNGSIPEQLWSCPSLRFVYLSNNTFSGELPSDEYFKGSTNTPSPYLEDIWIDNNSVSGSIPFWLFLLTNLKTFIAERNSFGGALPEIDSLGAVSATLQVLDLSFNNITGSLPAALFQGIGLSYLYLDNNKFNGNLPNYEPLETSLLIDVWLHSNQLVGDIPQNFGADWINLKEFSLQSNQLSGSLISGCSTTPQLWPLLTLLEADCTSTAVGSPVTCDCCTQCF